MNMTKRHWQGVISTIFIAWIALINLVLSYQPVHINAQDLPPNQVREVRWSPSGALLAITYQDGRLEVLSSADLTPIFTVQAHSTLSIPVAWSPDETLIASGGSHPDNALRIWDAQNGSLLYEFGDVGVDVSVVAWKPDGSQLIADAVEPLNISENTLVIDFPSQEVARIHLPTISDLKWSPDLRQIAITMFGSLRIIDADDFQTISEYQIERELFRPELQGQPIALTWNRAGSLIAAGMGDGRVFLWDSENPNSDAVITLIAHDYTGTDRFTGWVHALHFDETDQILTAISGDGTVRTWDIQTQRVISEQTISPNYAADISPLGVRAATGLSAPPDVVKDAELLIENRISNDQISIYVLNPTPAEFERVAELCGIPQTERATLAPQLVARDEATKAAAIDDIQAVAQHPACAADLLAVAEALLAESE